MREFTINDLSWIFLRLGAIAHKNETAKRTIELMQSAKDDMARLQVVYDLIHEIREYTDIVNRRIAFFNDVEHRFKKVKIGKRKGTRFEFSGKKGKSVVAAQASRGNNEV